MIFFLISITDVKKVKKYDWEKGGGIFVDTSVKMWYSYYNKALFVGGSMKKLLWFMTAVLVFTALSACGKRTTPPSTPITNETYATQSQSENGAVKVKQNENGSLTVNVDLVEYAGKDVSIVVANDRALAEKFESIDGVLALEQITLDSSGKGSVTLMPSENVDCFVGVNGKNIVEVKGQK